MTLSTEHLQQPFNEIEKLRKANETLRDEIAFLKEQLEWFKRQIFGQKAEKFIDPDNQQLCFEGFDSLNSTTVEEKKPVAAHKYSQNI